ncbi:chitobiase/beta-hexosaminidase C-terminal domain-containing protein [Xylanibacter rodentium]|uniref:chitobiase/beta-hexosaminidase C-terminal domain-containing protein n=1 Tax=Xylanibacter rodentium TaxID=2736289 RepID=UPI00258F9ACF|nr:chitobiase/beta-hexosaminidase C-terminal domain-containing protein [Xylanibacter rodentium]
MKKLLSFAMLFAFALCINAQQRKTWDFTKGVSDETLTNLQADAANWDFKTNGDGSFKEAVDKVKLFGEFVANGVVIKEFQGVRFGDAGLSKNNNFIIRPTSFRMSRAKEQVIFRVVPGQTITIKARSANGDAPDRGFKGDGNMEYVSGPENGICLGGNIEAEGRDDKGNFTLVWRVKDDAPTEGDSLDVTVSVQGGGCDIALFQIDEGDNPQTDKKQVAYLYDSSYPGYEFGENDPNYDVLVNMLSLELEAADIVAIDVAGNPADVTVDSLQYYNAVVVSSAINSTNPYINTIKSAIAYVPMLNLSPDLYEAWGYGAARETNTNILTVGDKASKADMFTDADGNSFVADGKLAIFESAVIRGYEAAAGTYFANDSVWAKADGVNAIHVHNANRNAYMLLPYTFPYGDLAENFPQLMSNAVLTVAGTKTEVTKSGKPSMVQDFSNFSTTVTLRCSTKGARIYYTLDGSEPTLNSTEFTEPFVVDVKDVVVKAISMADGYSVSDVMEAKVEIHELAKEPSFSCNEMDGATEVTLIPANEGEVIYYNITGSSEIERSEIYSEPIVLTRHQTITAFTAAYSDYLASEPVSKDIVVKNEKVRIDIVSHMDANKADWAPAGANPTYYNGKNGHAYYSDNVIEQTTDPETGDDIFVCEPANVVVWVNPNKGWEVRTEAQAVFWQNNGCTHNVGDGSGYNPETALDDDVNATSSCLSFGSSSTTNSFGTKNPSYTGSIQSTEAFQGPFDVVANIANTAKNGGNIAAYVYVTTDTLGGNWTELGELKTSTTGRLWKNTVLGYEGTDKVFVKVCASNSVGVFDIFIKNEGELSKEYIANVTGIEIVNSNVAAAGNVVRTMIYSINGTQLDKVAKGINIVKEVYANGVVKTKKIIVK